MNIIVDEGKADSKALIDLTSDNETSDVEIKEPETKKYKKSPDSKSTLNSKSVSEILEILQDVKEEEVKEGIFPNLFYIYKL